MDGRLTLCNMAIEAGAQAGMVAPDDVTFDYLRGRTYAPGGADWDRAMDMWSRLVTEPGASFDAEVKIEADELHPMVTWGTSPEHAVGVSGQIPDPEDETDGARRRHQRRALEYMGLRPGQYIADVPIDRVFIGSCTNARIDDLRQAARVLRGRKAVIPAWVVPGSGSVRRQAEREGLAQTFIDAGFEWRESGCSMCIGMNGDSLRPAERCASTSNRNFEGRQGRMGRTHLVSPATAAATALHGHIVDVRELGLTELE
jgi:3-isopropylmalate/(R)-2-methylmalate dehydratase large subunit